MIEAHHIYKTYGDTAILKDISFSLKPAEIVSIVGPSGAGKTTLLQILAEQTCYQFLTALCLNFVTAP